MASPVSLFLFMKRWTAVLLIGCLPLVSAGLVYSSVAHTHVGHHDQHSHGKIWCGWTCQAGQGHQVFSPAIPEGSGLLVFIRLDSPPFPDSIPHLQFSSRAPPLTFLV